jgi:uncharacterized phage-associated protein
MCCYHNLTIDTNCAQPNVDSEKARSACSGTDVGRTLNARSALLAIINDVLQELGIFSNGKVLNIPDRDEPWI